MEGALTWQSLQWKDGTKYNGLTKGGRMHSHGVLTFPNSDRYEGMFEDGRMHGAGVYVWSNGMVYRGDWQQGVMHGCGTCIWKDTAAGLKAVEGKFFGDEYVGDVMPCGRDDATDSAVDADMAAYQARSFQKASRPQQSQQQQRWQGSVNQQQPPAGQKSSAAVDQGAALASNRGAVAGLIADGGTPVDPQQEMRLARLLQRLATDKLQGSSNRNKQLT